MDGFGLAEPGPGNAISQARTPCLADEVFATRPWTKLEASGEAVGLPAGQMGNSEVGHLNIGAGRVVFQELTRINRACADGSLAANPVLNEAFAAAARPGAALHLMGLVSDGGVHSSESPPPRQAALRTRRGRISWCTASWTAETCRREAARAIWTSWKACWPS